MKHLNKIILTIVIIITTLSFKAQPHPESSMLSLTTLPNNSQYWNFTGQIEQYYTYNIYETPFPVFKVRSLMTIDTNNVGFYCLKSFIPSVNTSTRLCGLSDSGLVVPFDISTLPKQNLSINENTVSISGGNSITLPNATLTAGNGITITQVGNSFTIGLTPWTTNTVTRAVNTNYTVSATKESEVLYGITCSVTNPLLAGSSTANVFLEFSTNGGSTWQPATDIGNASTVGVAVAIAITNGQKGLIGGKIPAGATVRLRTTTTGTASVSSANGQESYR